MSICKRKYSLATFVAGCLFVLLFVSSNNIHRVESASLEKATWHNIDYLTSSTLSLLERTTEHIQSLFDRLENLIPIDGELSYETQKLFSRSIDTILSAIGRSVVLANETVNQLNDAGSGWFGFLLKRITPNLDRIVDAIVGLLNKTMASMLSLTERIFDRHLGPLTGVVLNGVDRLLDSQARMLSNTFNLIDRMIDSHGTDDPTVSALLSNAVGKTFKNLRSTVEVLLRLALNEQQQQQQQPNAASELDKLLRRIDNDLLADIEQKFTSLQGKCNCDSQSDLDIILDIRIRIRNYKTDCEDSTDRDADQDVEQDADDSENNDDEQSNQEQPPADVREEDDGGDENVNEDGDTEQGDNNEQEQNPSEPEDEQNNEEGNEEGNEENNDGDTEENQQDEEVPDKEEEDTPDKEALEEGEKEPQETDEDEPQEPEEPEATEEDEEEPRNEQNGDGDEDGEGESENSNNNEPDGEEEELENSENEESPEDNDPESEDGETEESENNSHEKPEENSEDSSNDSGNQNDSESGHSC